MMTDQAGDQEGLSGSTRHASSARVRGFFPLPDLSVQVIAGDAGW